jgi:hypothetical protein
VCCSSSVVERGRSFVRLFEHTSMLLQVWCIGFFICAGRVNIFGRRSGNVSICRSS